MVNIHNVYVALIALGFNGYTFMILVIVFMMMSSSREQITTNKRYV